MKKRYILLAFTMLLAPFPLMTLAEEPAAAVPERRVGEEPPEPQPEVAPAPAPEAEPSQYSADTVGQARLVSNEAGLMSRSRPGIDGALIGYIVNRNAEINDVTIAEWIAHAHHRHTRTTRTSNRWIAYLDGSLNRPTGWPEVRVPWESARGRMAWQARLDEAQSYQRGEIELVCPVAYPTTWGGPYTDAENLYRLLDTGRYVIVAGPRIASITINGVLRSELPGWRVDEPCFVGATETEAPLFAARNVYLARRP